MINSNRFVVELGLQFLVVRKLAHGLHEVFVSHVITLGTDGEKPSFGTHVAQICSVETVGQLHDCFVICVNKLKKNGLQFSQLTNPNRLCKLMRNKC